jgi:shikimate dehydrogenase
VSTRKGSAAANAATEPEPVNRLGVVGWPVSHSRSPAVQNAALAAAGLERSWRYQLLPVPPEIFRETVLALPGQGFRGVNVTIPHKHAALSLANTSSGRAQAIGAANTLLFRDGEIHADNTDAAGLIGELSRLIELEGASAVVLGAGGSARASVWALLDAGVADVSVWNRAADRAAALCADLGGSPVQDVGPADILVNCTSVGLDAEDTLNPLPVDEQTLRGYRVIADLVYREGGSVLTRAARAAGVPTVGGLDLLVAQGAFAYELFTGLPAPVEVMRVAAGLSSAP